MNIIKKISSQFINFILALLSCFSFVFALTDSLHFDFSPLAILGLVFVFLLLCTIAFYSRRTICISFAVFSILLIGSALFLIAKDLFSTFVYDFWVYVFWVMNFVQGFAAIDSNYALVTTLLVTLAFSVFVYFITMKYHRFLILLAAGIALFTVQWMFNYFTSYLAFYIFLFTILVYYFRYIFLRNVSLGSNRYVSVNVFTVWVVPLSALILLIAFVFPAKEDPLQWKWLDSKISKIYNYFNSSFITYRSFDYFSISNSGFGSSGALGGKVKLDKTVVLKVNSPRIVYLKGSSSDMYTGNSWKRTAKASLPLSDDSNELTDNFNQLMNHFNVAMLTYMPIETFFYKDTLKVSYANLQSKPIFLPLNAYRVSFGSKSNLGPTVSEDGILSSKKVLSKGFNYTFEAMNGKYEEDSFKDLCRLSTKGRYAQQPDDFNIWSILTTYRNFYGSDYVTWDEKANRYTYNNPSNYTQENNPGKVELSVHETDNTRGAIIGTFPASVISPDLTLSARKFYDKMNVLYERYLQLPDTLPKRVKNLAASITASSQNNYDKVKAIEQYLVKKYPYTLSPKSTPENRDFVDYFLFDLKEGYCTYYATAMTVLVRSIGIPARYVEGYVLPPKPKEGTTTYEVTNEQAHAWVEVYFDGVGWVPFEPTSPYTAAFYNTKNYEPMLSSSFAGNPYYSDYMDILKKYYQGKDLSGTSDIPEVKPVNKAGRIAFITILVFSLLILSFLILILVQRIRDKVRIHKWSTLSPREAILAYYLFYLKILDLAGMHLEPGETPSIYSERVDRYMGFEKGDSFKEVAQRFILSRYSRNPLTPEDQSMVSSFYKTLRKRVMRDISKPKYFFYRYMLGKI